jgi:NADP-dependent alcohol dehydrogenase
LLKKKIDFILAVGGGSVIDGVKFISAPLILKETNRNITKTYFNQGKRGAIWNCLNFACNRKRNELCAVVTIESTKEKLAFEDPLFRILILTLRSSNLYRKDNCKQSG